MTDGVVCRECGFANAPGDEFCGSCGTFLEWSEADAGVDQGAADADAGPAGSGTRSAGSDPYLTHAGPSQIRSEPEPEQAAASPASPPSPLPTPPPASPPMPQTEPAVGVSRAAGGLTRCPTCGTANTRGRAFCQSCGGRLPVGTSRLGGTGGRGGAGVGVDRRLLAGGGALALVLLVGVALVLSGAIPGLRGSPPGSASFPAGGGPLPTPSTSPGASSHVEPVGTDPAASIDPAESAAATTGPPSPPPPTDSPPTTDPTCEPSTLTASNTAVWEVRRAAWGPRVGFDMIELELTRQRRRSDQPARLTVEVLPPDEVSQRYGVDVPLSTDVAIVVALLDGPQLAGPIEGTREVGALRTIDILRDPTGVPLAVLGVNGEGCYRLSAEGWDEARAPAMARIVLEIVRT